jgi:uncharacterized protein HemX
MAVSAMVAAVAVSAGVAYDGHQQAKKAQEQTIDQAKKTATAADEANNKANQKRANSSALLSSNQMAAKAGQAGTMLTGPSGVDPSALQLGKTTLLGGGG